MIEECKKANVKLGVNLASRFQPCATEAKKLFERKIIGEIFFTKISCYARKPDDYWISPWLEADNKSWRASKKIAGGAIGIMNITPRYRPDDVLHGHAHHPDKGRVWDVRDRCRGRGPVLRTLAMGEWRDRDGQRRVEDARRRAREPTRVFGDTGPDRALEPHPRFHDARGH